MRKRNRAITIRMTDSEIAELNEKLKQTGLSQQTYVINAIRQAVILSVDGLRTLMEISVTFSDLIRQLRGMATNINQMARWANTTGILPTEQALVNISWQIEYFRRECEHIWQSIRLLSIRQKHTQECDPSSGMSSKTKKSGKAM